MDDGFYLGWFARECRFQASVHYAPKNRLGYRLHRRVIVSPKDEPALNLWLAHHGVHGRILKERQQIEKVMELLTPVRDHVVDMSGWMRMLLILDEEKGRKLTYGKIRRIIDTLDSSL
jgi:hypothetical protein